MAPLYAAVMHGCQAGRHQEALADLYWGRIQRGNEAFNTKKLGALGAEISVLSGFFDRRGLNRWTGLTEHARPFVLNEAGFDLRALGRLAEAAQPTQAGLETAIADGDSENAAKGASNLSELYLAVGDVKQAVDYAEQSVELAERSGDCRVWITNRTTLAEALHQAGRIDEAESAFGEAEEMEKQQQPALPFLCSLRGFRYCDLLLGKGEYEEVQSRAARTLAYGASW